MNVSKIKNLTLRRLVIVALIPTAVIPLSLFGWIVELAKGLREGSSLFWSEFKLVLKDIKGVWVNDWTDDD